MAALLFYAVTSRTTQYFKKSVATRNDWYKLEEFTELDQTFTWIFTWIEYLKLILTDIRWSGWFWFLNKHLTDRHNNLEWFKNSEHSPFMRISYCPTPNPVQVVKVVVKVKVCKTRLLTPTTNEREKKDSKCLSPNRGRSPFCGWWWRA